jgi:hypothetical protein
MYEQASERWSPVQSVEKVILSVISMLAGMQLFVLDAKQAVNRGAPPRTKLGERCKYRLLQIIPGQQSSQSVTTMQLICRFR